MSIRGRIRWKFRRMHPCSSNGTRSTQTAVPDTRNSRRCFAHNLGSGDYGERYFAQRLVSSSDAEGLGLILYSIRLSSVTFVSCFSPLRINTTSISAPGRSLESSVGRSEASLILNPRTSERMSPNSIPAFLAAPSASIHSTVRSVSPRSLRPISGAPLGSCPTANP